MVVVIVLVTVLEALAGCVYVTVIPLVPFPLAITPLANVVGIPVSVTTPVPDAYDVVAPVGRLPTVTPLNPLANVRVYVRPDAVDGPVLRNTTVPLTVSPAFTLDGKLSVVVTSAINAPPVVAVGEPAVAADVAVAAAFADEAPPAAPPPAPAPNRGRRRRDR